MEYGYDGLFEEQKLFELKPTLEFQIRYPIFWSVFGKEIEVKSDELEAQSDYSDVDIISLMNNLEIS